MTTTNEPTYTSYRVDVTHADGREPQRGFKTEAAARRYYDRMVADPHTTRVLLFGYDSEGTRDGIDGWWADERTEPTKSEPTFTIDQVNALTEKARGLRPLITAAYIRAGAMHLDLLFMAPKGMGWKQMGKEFWRWDGERWQAR